MATSKRLLSPLFQLLMGRQMSSCSSVPIGVNTSHIFVCPHYLRKVKRRTSVLTCAPSSQSEKWSGGIMHVKRYSQPLWLWPMGKIDRPRTKDLKEPTSALVLLEDLNPRSLTYLEMMHNASSRSEVFDILSSGGSNLTEVHYGRALCRLADIHVEEQEDVAQHGLIIMTTAPVLYDSEFRELCHIILNRSRHLDNGLFINILGALHKLRVPLKSSLTYTLLAQAEQRINILTASELAEFASILGKYQQNDPRVDALMSAVALLTPRHIPNLTSLSRVLSLVNTVGTRLRRVSRHKLATMLLAILAADEERSLRDIISAVLAMHKMDYRLDILLELACPVLTQNLKDLSQRDIHGVLCALGGLKYQSQHFLEAASDRIVESVESWNLKWLMDASVAFSVLNVQAPLMMDSIVRRVMNSSREDLSLADFTKLMKSMADLEHRPPLSWNFEEFACRAAKNLVSEESRLSLDECRTVLTLSHAMQSLGIFSTEMMNIVASREFANCIMMVKDEREYRRIIRDVSKLLHLLRASTDESKYSEWTESIKKLIPDDRYFRVSEI